MPLLFEPHVLLAPTQSHLRIRTQGLSALAKGDAEAATGVYEELVDRWRAIQLLERCN